MHPTQFFTAKCVLVVVCSTLGTLVAAGGTAAPVTTWQWIMLVAGCTLNGGTALKAYLSDASANRAP